MYIDGHIHLENGPLSMEYAMKFVKAGVAAGMDEIQILDHTHRFSEFAPMYERLKTASPYQKEWLEKKRLQPLSDYFALIEEMKQKDLPIRVKWGLEVCYDPTYKDFLKSVLANIRMIFSSAPFIPLMAFCMICLFQKRFYGMCIM